MTTDSVYVLKRPFELSLVDTPLPSGTRFLVDHSSFDAPRTVTEAMLDAARSVQRMAQLELTQRGAQVPAPIPGHIVLFWSGSGDLQLVYADGTIRRLGGVSRPELDAELSKYLKVTELPTEGEETLPTASINFSPDQGLTYVSLQSLVLEGETAASLRASGAGAVITGRLRLVPDPLVPDSGADVIYDGECDRLRFRVDGAEWREVAELTDIPGDPLDQSTAIAALEAANVALEARVAELEALVGEFIDFTE